MRQTVLTVMLAVAVATIGIADVASGALAGFTLFYLAPITYAALATGRRTAIAVAVEAAAFWSVAEAVRRPPVGSVDLLWESTTRFVIFVGAALLIADLQHERTALRALEERRRQFLRLLERNLPEPIARADEQIARIEPAAIGAAPQHTFALLHRAIDDLRYLSREFLILGQADIDRRPPEAVDLVEAAGNAARYVDQGRVDIAGATTPLLVYGEQERVEHAIAAILRSASRVGSGDIWLALREREDEALVEVTAESTLWLVTDDDDDLALARLVARLYGGRLTARTGDATTTVALAFPSTANRAVRA